MRKLTFITLVAILSQEKFAELTSVWSWNRIQILLILISWFFLISFLAGTVLATLNSIIRVGRTLLRKLRKLLNSTLGRAFRIDDSRMVLRVLALSRRLPAFG
jgi:hypothetical protein